MKRRPPKLKKSIKGFLMDEEGAMDSKSLAKMGVSIAVISLFLCSSAKDGIAGHTSVPAHTDSYLDQSGGNGAHHSSLTPHSDSHSSGGWC